MERPEAGGAGMSEPLVISIVTPSYNHASYLRATLDSVLDQDYPTLDYIVMDGGSTDATPALLDAYRPRLAHCTSESDRGQSHALNKGFALARGQIYGWINSDDLLEPGALQAVAAAYRPGRVLYAGLVVSFVDGTTQEWVERQDGLTFERLARFWEGQMADGWWLQPGVFFNREVWEAAGPLDEAMHLSMDYDFLLKALEGAEVVFIEQALARFRRHPAQKTFALAAPQIEEMSHSCKRFWGDRFAPFQRPHDRWMAHSLVSNAGLQAMRGRLITAFRTWRRACHYDWLAALTDLPRKLVSAPLRWWRRRRRGRADTERVDADRS